MHLQILTPSLRDRIRGSFVTSPTMETSSGVRVIEKNPGPLRSDKTVSGRSGETGSCFTKYRFGSKDKWKDLCSNGGGMVKDGSDESVEIAFNGSVLGTLEFARPPRLSASQAQSKVSCFCGVCALHKIKGRVSNARLSYQLSGTFDSGRALCSACASEQPVLPSLIGMMLSADHLPPRIHIHVARQWATTSSP